MTGERTQPASTATHPIHPNDPMFGTSCDWGYCDGAAKWWRWERDIREFLPVCDTCRRKRYEAVR